MNTTQARSPPATGGGPGGVGSSCAISDSYGWKQVDPWTISFCKIGFRLQRGDLALTARAIVQRFHWVESSRYSSHRNSVSTV